MKAEFLCLSSKRPSQPTNKITSIYFEFLIYSLFLLLLIHKYGGSGDNSSINHHESAME